MLVSDEHGGGDASIDAASNKFVANIPLGGGKGNTVYDSVSGQILVAVHDVNLLTVIDPATNQIISRIPVRARLAGNVGEEFAAAGIDGLGVRGAGDREAMVGRIDSDVIPAAFAAGMEGGSNVPTLRADREGGRRWQRKGRAESVYEHECSPRKSYSLGRRSS